MCECCWWSGVGGGCAVSSTTSSSHSSVSLDNDQPPDMNCLQCTIIANNALCVEVFVCECCWWWSGVVGGGCAVSSTTSSSHSSVHSSVSLDNDQPPDMNCLQCTIIANNALCVEVFVCERCWWSGVGGCAVSSTTSSSHSSVHSSVSLDNDQPPDMNYLFRARCRTDATPTVTSHDCSESAAALQFKVRR